MRLRSVVFEIYLRSGRAPHQTLFGLTPLIDRPGSDHMQGPDDNCKDPADRRQEATSTHASPLESSSALCFRNNAHLRAFEPMTITMYLPSVAEPEPSVQSACCYTPAKP